MNKLKRGRNTHVSAVIPDFVKVVVDRAVENRKQTISEFIGNVILENIMKYEELTELEKTAVNLKKQEIKTNMIKYIRSKSAERLFFLKNIKKQLLMFFNDNITNNKKEIMDNMSWNLELAKECEWVEEEKILNKFIKYLKENKRPTLLEIRRELDTEEENENKRKEKTKNSDATIRREEKNPYNKI